MSRSGNGEKGGDNVIRVGCVLFQSHQRIDGARRATSPSHPSPRVDTGKGAERSSHAHATELEFFHSSSNTTFISNRYNLLCVQGYRRNDTAFCEQPAKFRLVVIVEDLPQPVCSFPRFPLLAFRASVPSTSCSPWPPPMRATAG